MKALLRPVLQKLGLWAVAVRVQGAATRCLRSTSYSAAVGLRLGFAAQLRLLRPPCVQQPIFVRTSSITDVVLRRGLTKFRIVRDGDWDLKRKPIMADVYATTQARCQQQIGFRAMYEIFVENMPINETYQYKEVERVILTGDEAETAEHGWTSIEQFVEYMESYEHVFNNIKKNGYKTQDELGNHPIQSEDYPLRQDEIRVCIGRDGELMWHGEGSHRLAMARILGIEYIPVTVWTVHRIWAEHCFKEYGGGVLEAIFMGFYHIDCRHLARRDGAEAQLQPEVLASGDRDDSSLP